MISTVTDIVGMQMNFWRWLLLLAIAGNATGLVDVRFPVMFGLTMLSLAGPPYQTHRMQVQHDAEHPVKVVVRDLIVTTDKPFRVTIDREDRS